MFIFTEGFTIKGHVRRRYSAQGQEEKAWISASVVFQEEGEIMRRLSG